jgi:hypothetical protein
MPPSEMKNFAKMLQNIICYRIMMIASWGRDRGEELATVGGRQKEESQRLRDGEGKAE